MNKGPSILKKIFELKRRRVDDLKALLGPGGLHILESRARAAAAHEPGFALSKALRRTAEPGIIAEFKRASPSKGVINDTSEPAKQALGYESAGAAAVSVLTEEDHFRGSLEDLKKIRTVIRVPILRKDFIFDPFQLYESRAAGANAILLIVAMLEDRSLAGLMEIARELGLDALVEVHNREELQRAIRLNAELIGVNNRDLNTFEVSIEHSRKLAEHKPKGALMISESGIHSPEQISELASLGFDGFLVGEALMKAGRDKRNDILAAGR